ncbi:N-6 DNA methylase [Humibacter soli]
MTSQTAPSERLVKSKRRVADHGEVFTPAWLVSDMLDLVRPETDRIDSRFLEPACGSGNFLVPVLQRKLAAVQARHGGSDFEKKHYALFALMCVYGIELLADNAAECRANLSATFSRFLDGPDRATTEDPPTDDVWTRAAAAVLAVNIVQGDALQLTDASGIPITFPEWGYLGRGKYQRRDFRYDHLTQRASIRGTLFGALDEHDVFRPIRTYPPLTAREIAA